MIEAGGRCAFQASANASPAFFYAGGAGGVGSVTDTFTVVVADAAADAVTSTLTFAPALMFVLIFIPRPPYKEVVFLGLVTGLRPLGSRVAMEVSR